jgi:hypothetical protein
MPLIPAGEPARQVVLLSRTRRPPGPGRLGPEPDRPGGNDVSGSGLDGIAAQALVWHARQWPVQRHGQSGLRLGVKEPARILVLAELALACSVAGIGYPALLVRAGALGQALLLAAAVRGYGATLDTTPSQLTTGAAPRVNLEIRHLLTVWVTPEPSADEERWA